MPERASTAALGLVLGAAIFVCAGSEAARAQDAPRWFTVGGEAGPYAKWGIPETDAVGFSVTCMSDGSVLVEPGLWAMSEPDALPEIKFQVDGQTYLRDAKLGFSERDSAWQAAAVVERNDALIDALRRGSKLTYDFEPALRDGDRFTISLSGSAKAIDEALKGC